MKSIIIGTETGTNIPGFRRGFIQFFSVIREHNFSMFRAFVVSIFIKGFHGFKTMSADSKTVFIKINTMFKFKAVLIFFLFNVFFVFNIVGNEPFHTNQNSNYKAYSETPVKKIALQERDGEIHKKIQNSHNKNRDFSVGLIIGLIIGFSSAFLTYQKFYKNSNKDK